MADDCTLECPTIDNHTSSCQIGTGPYGHYQGKHCAPCPPTRAGVWCDVMLDVCPDGVTTCVSGKSVCTPVDDATYTCTRQPSHQLCLPQAPVVEYAGGMALPYFCVNGGTCRDVIIGSVGYSTCDCPKGYTGDHCELRLPAGGNHSYVVRLQGDGSDYYFGPHEDLPPPFIDNAIEKSDGDERRMGGMIAYTIILAFLAVSSAVAGRRWKQLRRRRRTLEGAMIRRHGSMKTPQRSSNHDDDTIEFSDERSPDSVVVGLRPTPTAPSSSVYSTRRRRRPRTGAHRGTGNYNDEEEEYEEEDTAKNDLFLEVDIL